MANNPHDPLSIMLTSRDMKRSLAFYKDTLGFQIEHVWPDEKNPMWAGMVMGRQSIMLGGLMPPDVAEQLCASDPDAVKMARSRWDDFQKNKPGVGLITYVMVPDVDKYHAEITKKGVKALSAPKSQFYGIRDFPVQDPDGYQLLFYTPIQMSSCQSCGMPMKDAKPGAMYCPYCTDDKGNLKPYEKVFEGTTTGYFMNMQKMPRKEAEVAAKKHLATMPAWKGRG